MMCSNLALPGADGSLGFTQLAYVDRDLDQWSAVHSIPCVYHAAGSGSSYAHTH